MRGEQISDPKQWVFVEEGLGNREGKSVGVNSA
jgi:hypothetical protein